MKRYLLLLFPFLCLATGAQTIKVQYEKKLDLGLNEKILVEHHLTVHPVNPDFLLLSGMYVGPSSESDYRDYSIVSKDNGKTWTNLKIFGVPDAADPWAEISAKGTAIFTVLGFNNLYVYRSVDGGIHWQADSTHLGKAHDHQTIVVDDKQGLFYIVSIQGNHIYVTFSKNEGVSFSSPRKFNFSNLSANTMTPIVTSDGNLLIPYSTFQRTVIDQAGKKSTVWMKNNLNWLITYNHKSDTWGVPSLISEACEKGFPVLAVDKSDSKFKDRLYYVCSNQTNGEILFHYSDTRGQSWSLPVNIKKFTNHSASPKNPFTGIPQVTVNNKGVVGVAWQDRTVDPDGKCQQLYFSVSLDGGRSFLKPVRVSKVRSCQENPQNLFVGEKYKDGGHYIGFVSKPNGNFLVTWADSRDGISQLYMAEISVE